jgi:hypothetical protein
MADVLLPFCYGMTIMAMIFYIRIWTWLFFAGTITIFYLLHRRRDIEADHALGTSEHTSDTRQDGAIDRWVEEVNHRRENGKS